MHRTFAPWIIMLPTIRLKRSNVVTYSFSFLVSWCLCGVHQGDRKGSGIERGRESFTDRWSDGRYSPGLKKTPDPFSLQGRMGHRFVRPREEQVDHSYEGRGAVCDRHEPHPHRLEAPRHPRHRRQEQRTSQARLRLVPLRADRSRRVDRRRTIVPPQLTPFSPCRIHHITTKTPTHCSSAGEMHRTFAPWIIMLPTIRLKRSNVVTYSFSFLVSWCLCGVHQGDRKGSGIERGRESFTDRWSDGRYSPGLKKTPDPFSLSNCWVRSILALISATCCGRKRLIVSHDSRRLSSSRARR